jgi:hypothetical protein
MYPLPGYSASVREVYTTSAPALQPDDANNAWFTVLNEIDALRVADPEARHYYGVVRIGYSSGLAGLGFFGVGTAIGYDRDGDRARIAAHELGHTWNRQHAPCGNPPWPDPDFPFQNGRIGRIGWDRGTGLLQPRDQPDVMGYCASPWISDYTYQGVMDFRGTAAGRASDGARPALLVWGRIVEGRAVLEPAFRVVSHAEPRRPGPYAVEGTAADGSRVFAVTFDAPEIADHPRAGRLFAFTVPMGDADAARLEQLRLTGPGIGMAAVARPAAALRTGPATPARMEATAAGVSLQWNAAAHPMVMVRDARSGQVLSFARGGSVTLPAPGGGLELVASDGVRSRVLDVSR